MPPGNLGAMLEITKKGLPARGIARDLGKLHSTETGQRQFPLRRFRFLDTHRKLRNDATNAMLMRGMLIRFVLRPGSTSSAANRSLRDMGAAPYRRRQTSFLRRAPPIR